MAVACDILEVDTRDSIYFTALKALGLNEKDLHKYVYLAVMRVRISYLAVGEICILFRDVMSFHTEIEQQLQIQSLQACANANDKIKQSQSNNNVESIFAHKTTRAQQATGNHQTPSQTGSWQRRV